MNDFSAVLVLGTYLAAWWLAIHVLGGYRFAELEWIPVAIAFVFPIMIADVLHGTGWDNWAVGAWCAIPLIIDAVWLVRRLMHPHMVEVKTRLSRWRSGLWKCR